MKTVFHTRRLGLGFIAALIVLAPHLAWAQMAPSSDDPVLPDPVPNQGTQYPPAAATAGQAYVGPPKAIPHDQCSPLTPCALPSSAPHPLGPLANSGG